MDTLKRFLTNKWLWVAIVLIAFGAGYYYYQNQAKSNEALVTVNPQYRAITESIELSGAIDASEKAILRFPGSSKLTWVNVKEGDFVKKWQAIATVDTATLQKQLEQDFNNFEKTWRVHDQTLDDVNYYSETGLTDEFKRIAEKSHFDLENSAINVEIRDLAIKLSTLISPIDGLVVKIDQPFAGTNISPTDTFQIVNPETIEFKSVVDEEDVSLIEAGQSVELVIDSHPDESISGVVETIDFIPSQSESGGTGYGVTILFPVDNQSLKYRLGMNGTAIVIISKKDNILSIPTESLIFRDGQSFVEVLEGGEIVRRQIETGLESDKYIEVTSGLSESDLVVVPNGSEEK
jgi:macrolide-specific efflux system membrane fusion protein